MNQYRIIYSFMHERNDMHYFANSMQEAESLFKKDNPHFTIHQIEPLNIN